MLRVNKHPANGRMLLIKTTKVRDISFPGHCLCGTDHNTVFANFLSNVAKDSDKVLIVTYPPGTSDTAASKEFTIDVTFLGVLNVRGITGLVNGAYISIQCSLQLVGSVDLGLSISASLYIKIPFTDKVRIAHLDGALGTGVTVDINTGIATGTATLTAEQNSSGTHDLYIDANLSCEFIGNLTTGKFFLFTSP